VLSNNDGVAIARSKEAKELGILMGDPYFKIKKLCERGKVSVFSSNFSLYTDISKRVMNVLKGYGKKIEVYSVDEAFLDISGIKDENLEDYAFEIKKSVERLTGIPVSVGIAPSKTLAKLANNLAKKDESLKGCLALGKSRDHGPFLKKVFIQDIWGVAKGKSRELHSMGIKTALEFRDYKNTALIRKKLTIVGAKMQQELRGVACFPLEVFRPKKKEISCSRTFSTLIFDIDEIKESVAKYISLSAQRLRDQQSLSTRVEIFMRGDLFSKEERPAFVSEHVQLLEGSSFTGKLIEKSFELIDRIYISGVGYKKVGVRLSGLFDQSEHQLSFFQKSDTKKEDKLMKVMDRINKKEGDMTVRSAACGVKKEVFKMKRNLLSPRYTTSWTEIKKVK
jgi:DNA polymerase V